MSGINMDAMNGDMGMLLSAYSDPNFQGPEISPDPIVKTPATGMNL